MQFFPFPTLNSLFEFIQTPNRDQDCNTTKETRETQKKFPPKISKLHSRSKKIKPRKKIPKNALDVLKGWLNQNIHDPYPSNEIKKELAKKAGLDFKQVND